MIQGLGFRDLGQPRPQTTIIVEGLGFILIKAIEETGEFQEVCRLFED